MSKSKSKTPTGTGTTSQSSEGSGVGCKNTHDSSSEDGNAEFSHRKSEVDAEFDEAVALEKDKNFIEYDVVTMIPRDRKPKRLVHVTVVDEILMYLVQWKNETNDSEEEEEVNAENTSVVDGRMFRELFPQMVIQFYESRIEKIQPPSMEELAKLACEALVKSQERKSRPPLKFDSDSEDECVEEESKPAPRTDRFGLPLDLDSSTSDESNSEDSDSD